MRVPGSLASDVRSLDALRTGAAKDPSGAVRQAATQFEALFMQMVLKSMRDAVPRSGMLEGPGADVYQGMLDTQFAQAMAGRPGGLGELIARQLMRNLRTDAAQGAPQASGAAVPVPPSVSAAGLARALLAQDTAAGDADDPEGSPFPHAARLAAAAAARARSAVAPRAAPEGSEARIGGPQAEFVDRMWPAALAAERRTGVPAGFIVGQSALESGWGRQEPRHADGRASHNLFGIKAGVGWRGAVVEAATTEYVDGRPIRTVERFRAYDSYEDAFADWARLMASSPRYAEVLRTGGSIESFAQGLQRAGYATDPQYASKLARTITTALSLRRESS